jgi:hypothetical protein
MDEPRHGSFEVRVMPHDGPARVGAPRLAIKPIRVPCKTTVRESTVVILLGNPLARTCAGTTSLGYIPRGHIHLHACAAVFTAVFGRAIFRVLHTNEGVLIKSPCVDAWHYRRFAKLMPIFGLLVPFAFRTTHSSNGGLVVYVFCSSSHLPPLSLVRCRFVLFVFPLLVSLLLGVSTSFI